MTTASRVLARWAKSKEIPVKNKETGRTVYVLPETLKKNPGKFEKLPPEQAGDIRWRGKPKPPEKPRKPNKPEVPREPPPAPVRPEKPTSKVRPMKPVTEVEPVKPMKVPKPNPPPRWKVLKKYLASLRPER